MKCTSGSVSRLLPSVIILSGTLASVGLAHAQQPKGVPWDWTHSRVVFSQPGTADEAIRKGAYEHWLKISTAPRFMVQQQRRLANAAGIPHQDFAHGISAYEPPPPESRNRQPGADLQQNDSRENAGNMSGNMSLEERWAAQVGNRQLPFGLSRAILPPVQRGGGTSTRRSVGSGSPWSSNTSNRIKKDWSELLGSGGSIGLGQFPATFTSGSTSCSDFVIFNTGLAGSSTQANIIAFKDIYASCNGGVPTVYWAYNTGGTVLTSVTLSLDGSQVAFVQSSSGGVASLVLLTWRASNGTLTVPVIPASETPALYRGCTTPCMTAMTFSGSSSDTYSAPFTAYGASKIYVGDDLGVLHQFSNIFASSGTPAEVTTGGWPVTVNANASLASPVYDAASGKAFVGDYVLNSSSPCEPSSTNSNTPCGYLYSVDSSGSVTRSAQLDYNSGILDGPIVDSTTEEVFAFAGDDGSSSCAASTPCAAVYQFSANFVSDDAGIEATVGSGYQFMLSGALDNAYFTSLNGTGHLYVVGNTGPANNTVYQVSINNAVMASGAATAGPVVSTNYTNGYNAAGLQVTEFYPGGSNDYIFLSVLAYGAPGACGTASLGNGCVIGYNVFSGTISGSTTPTGATAEAGGTSGIVVDNSASGAQNIYFSTLLNQTCTTSGGTGGCAIQTVQSAP
jgi:hypothetical protein